MKLPVIKVMRRFACQHCFGWSERRQGNVCYRCGLFVAEPAPAGSPKGVLRHRPDGGAQVSRSYRDPERGVTPPPQ